MTESDLNRIVDKRLASEGIVREAVTQSSEFLLKQNHYSIMLVLRQALQSVSPLLNISPGSEAVLYLHELYVDMSISVPADRGHAYVATTAITKTNTNYSSSVGTLVGSDARDFMNNEVLAGVNASQAWARNTSHNMVTLWPVRQVSAEANRRCGFERKDYLFGKGAQIGANHCYTLSRPRGIDTSTPKRDYTEKHRHVLFRQKGDAKKIKIRRNVDGKFIFSHDMWMLLRADDEARTLSSDDVVRYEQTIYCRFSAKE